MIKATTSGKIDNVYNEQRKFFNSHRTKDLKFRIESLKKFRAAINKYEDRIMDALWEDLHKSNEEAFLSEISIVTREIDLHIKNLSKWSRPKKVPTPVHLLPSSSRIRYEPLGMALIIAPWNYPFQLLMNPLVGAIAAGCCAILKPSEFTTNIAGVMEDLIKEIFAEDHIALMQGGKEVGEELLKKKFDIIFFTGSTQVGRIVMKAAAEHLTPVILELGGKSPCIVAKDADIEKAAKRIAWGKTINAGQTCIAPDYLLVYKPLKEELIGKMQEHLLEMYGEDPRESKYYPRIVNEKTFDKLTALLKNTRGNLRFGGQTHREGLYISPTILDDVQPDDALMQEEIFGPLLPILTYSHLEEAINFINSREKPLALYYFGKDKEAREVLNKTSSGGTGINDTLMHITNHHLPFGGVGNSGQGMYHGKESFLAFSHQRAVISTPTWIDVPFKYAPFRFFNFVKRIL